VRAEKARENVVQCLSPGVVGTGKQARETGRRGDPRREPAHPKERRKDTQNEGKTRQTRPIHSINTRTHGEERRLQPYTPWASLLLLCVGGVLALLEW